LAQVEANWTGVLHLTLISLAAKICTNFSSVVEKRAPWCLVEDRNVEQQNVKI
jgi:hypothetical protein